MWLFRRRAGRHAAVPPPPTGPAPGRRPGSPGSLSGIDVTALLRQPPTRQPTGEVRPDGQVRLGFEDGSVVSLSPDDPRVRAFRALAKELGRRD
jgi:hypothetical protein